MTPLPSRRRTVGLLGGSFNPAHEGHVHISMHALNALGLDEVWWLVSPHNPLKDISTLADYRERLDSAYKITARTPIRVSDIEGERGLRYTYETIRFLKQHYPQFNFVWLMGADNLVYFHRWQRWRELLREVPVVVFDRAPYSHASKGSKTYQYMRKFLIRDRGLAGDLQAPALRFVHLKRAPQSSTDIRKTLGKSRVLRHNGSVG